MTIKNVTGTITNQAGAVQPFNGSFDVVDAPVLDSLVITPTSGVPGTLFTITVNAHDVNTPPQTPLSYAVLVNGVAATPTGQPNVFTYQS